MPGLRAAQGRFGRPPQATAFRNRRGDVGERESRAGDRLRRLKVSAELVVVQAHEVLLDGSCLSIEARPRRSPVDEADEQ